MGRPSTARRALHFWADVHKLSDVDGFRRSSGALRDWTRKYPREIDQTTDPGEAGWRARCLDTTITGYPDIYEHDGADWLLAEDQLMPPDVIEVVGPYEHMQVGDYIGPWLFNEMWTRLQEGEYFMGSLQSGGSWTTVINESAGSTSNWSTGLTVAAAQAEAQSDWPVPDHGYNYNFTQPSTPTIYSFYGTNGVDDNYRAGIYSKQITYTPPATNESGVECPSRVFDLFAKAETFIVRPTNQSYMFLWHFADHGWGMPEDHFTGVGFGIDAATTVGLAAQPDFIASTLPKFVSRAEADGFQTQVAVIVRPTYAFES